MRIQWDPERNMILEPLPYRTIQIGLSNEAVSKYVNEWVQQITDITQTVTDIKKLIDLKEFEKATNLFPIEKIYPYSFIENAE